MPDTANVALGGLLLAQAVVTQAFSVLLAAAEAEGRMIGYFILLGGPVLFATVVGVWDILARRQHRLHKHKKSA